MSASSLSVRPAGSEDATEIHRLFKALAEAVGEADHYDSSPEAILRDAFGPSPHYWVVLAEVDQRPAGVASYFLGYSTYKGQPVLHVNDLYAEPWARGLGLARSLMAYMGREALALNCCRMEVRVLESNPAKAFYRSIGMSQVSELPFSLAGESLRAFCR